MRPEDASIVAELQARNEDAYARLIAQYHQTIYNLIYRILDDPSDAPDTTQEVFIKIFRGMLEVQLRKQPENLDLSHCHP